MKRIKVLNTDLKDFIVIGVTGHIDLIGGENLEISVRNILLKLHQKHLNGRREVVLICLGAEGADQFVAGIAIGLGMRVIGLHLTSSPGSFSLSNPLSTIEADLKPVFTWLDLMSSTQRIERIFCNDHDFDRQIRRLDEIINPDNRDIAERSLLTKIHEAGAEIIAGYSDYLIALWDGVDNGKTGGSYSTFSMALHGRDHLRQKIYFSPEKKEVFTAECSPEYLKNWIRPKGLIYHIVTPRAQNPFPVGRFPTLSEEFAPNAGVYETSTIRFPKIPFSGNWGQKKWHQFKRAVVHNGLLFNFLLPALLALFTVVLGTIGFALKRGATTPIQANDLFNAINLITFNSSGDVPIEAAPLALLWARWLALVFVLNAFLVAFLFAIGKNNKVMLKAFYFKIRGFSFYILAGLNDQTISLARDMIRKGRKVILISGVSDQNKIADANKNGLTVFHGNSYSSVSLKRIFAAFAAKVFLLDEEDVINIRTIQEVAQLSQRNYRTTSGQNTKERYIHLGDARYKDFVSKTNPDGSGTVTYVFNQYETIARSLLLQFPVGRFRLETPEIAEVFIFGFGDMGEQIALACLRNGFYPGHHQLKITVYALDHEERAKEFYKRYPVLNMEDMDIEVYQRTFAQVIKNMVFPLGTLTFKELPLSDAAYFSDEAVHKAISQRHIVSIYFCLSEPMKSAAYLHALLPKIRHLQCSEQSAVPVCDVQCFCYYPLYDLDEVRYAEHIVNAKLPNAFVKFFGSLAEESTESALTRINFDRLPKLINLWYTHDRPLQQNGQKKPSELLRKERQEFWFDRSNITNYPAQDRLKEADLRWSELSIAQKESNRYAADHLWIKLHALGITYAKIERLAMQDLSELIRLFDTQQTAPMADKLKNLARTEHARWCAEKLLDGFLPAQDFDVSLADNQAGAVHLWNTKKVYKSYYQEQKLHIDLLPFDELFSGSYAGHPYNEKEKDLSLVEAIPYLIYGISNK